MGPWLKAFPMPRCVDECVVPVPLLKRAADGLGASFGWGIVYFSLLRPFFPVVPAARRLHTR